MTTSRQIGVFCASLLGLAVLVAVNAWGFHRFSGINYFSWYLENGAAISIGVSLAALIFEELEVQKDLISAHPLRYFAACCSIAGLFFHALSTHFSTPRQAPNRSETPLVLTVWDTFVSVLLLIPLVLVSLAWVFVVGPLNYVVTLVSGALARKGLEQRAVRSVAVEQGLRVDMVTQAADAPLPSGGVDISLSRKPLALTQALTSLVLWVGGLAYEVLA